jgi:hypothetical protein
MKFAIISLSFCCLALCAAAFIPQTQGLAMTSADTNMQPIPFDSYWSIEKVQKVLKTEFPLGTPWEQVERRLINSGVGCEAPAPYPKLPENVTVSEETRKSEESIAFFVRCTTPPSWSMFRSYHGITFDARLDKDKHLLLIVASPYYRHS